MFVKDKIKVPIMVFTFSSIVRSAQNAKLVAKKKLLINMGKYF